jgi:hypothetical protein
MMTNKTGEYVSQLKPTEQQKHSDKDEAEWADGYGHYQYCVTAQDQIIAYLEGMKISGTFTRKGDIQSDYIGTSAMRLSKKEIQEFLNKHRIVTSANSFWEVTKHSFDEAMMLSGSIEEQIDAPSNEITDDVSQWSSDQLISAILHPQAESDMAHLRETILIAEDTSFTMDQSERLAPWLLNFVERYRDSNDSQDVAAVLSAIRTGASMLRSQDANKLLSLLEPGHSIETSLVTVKMLGRIFEAQPPREVDEHRDLAEKVYQMANSLLNEYAITLSRSAAMAQLAIYALTAMASSKTQRIVETVKQLNVTWFTQQTLRELHGLYAIWENQQTTVSKPPRQLLDKVLKMLE